MFTAAHSFGVRRDKQSGGIRRVDRPRPGHRCPSELCPARRLSKAGNLNRQRPLCFGQMLQCVLVTLLTIPVPYVLQQFVRSQPGHTRVNADLPFQEPSIRKPRR